MSIIKKSLFVFEEIDLQNGSCVIRFINPHGVIETKQKTLNDFKQMIDVPTGSFELNGKPITRKKEIIINDNPNDDLIYSLDIPLNGAGEYIDLDDLVDYVARQYPDDIFIRKHQTSKASKNIIKNNSLKSLEKKRFDIEILNEARFEARFGAPDLPPGFLSVEEL